MRAVGFVSCVAVASAIFVACGSEDGKKQVPREDVGGAGQAGAGNAPEPSAGSGGALGLPEGGVGGVSTPPEGGVGGAFTAPEGGVGGVFTAPEGGTGGAPTEPQPECDEIVFADSMLEQAVRYAVDKPDGAITPEDVLTLTELRTYDVHDLSGIECLSNLSIVDLSQGGQQSSLTSLAPLRFLENLEELNLGRTQLTSLDGIEQIPNLRRLDLYNDTLGSLAPLADAPALEQLVLDFATVGDVSSLGNIATLQHVSLYYASVTMPATLSALDQVKVLDLTAAITDAAPLAGLTQLEDLTLGGQLVANVGSLDGLVNLKNLAIGGTGTSNLGFMTGMTKLETFGAVNNGIVDVTALGGLTQLKAVSLQNNEIMNVAALAANNGIGTGDSVFLRFNDLDCTSQAANIKAMRDRGATVETDCP
jgi:hypothetical protein